MLCAATQRFHILCAFPPTALAGLLRSAARACRRAGDGVLALARHSQLTPVDEGGSAACWRRRRSDGC